MYSLYPCIGIWVLADWDQYTEIEFLVDFERSFYGVFGLLGGSAAAYLTSSENYE